VSSKAPIVKIVKRSALAFFARRGERFWVYLSCGHMEKMTRTEARTKNVACWDCYYHKPTVWEGKK